MPGALKISFSDALGNITDKTYEKNNITAKTAVVNPSDSGFTAKLILAFYTGNMLGKAVCENVFAVPGETVYAEVSGKVPDGADMVRAFIWSEGLRPLALPEEILVLPPYECGIEN